MTSSNGVEELVPAIASAMPGLSRAQQRIAVAVYRTLAEGRPAEPAQLARRTGLDEATIRENLASWPGVFRDEDGRVVGFWGLAIPEMPHRFEVDGVDIHAWCAYDPLFIAPLLGTPGRVESKDPQTGEVVTLTVGPDGAEDVSPAGAVVSFLKPAEPWGQNVIQSFCHFVHFFGSRASGESWVSNHPGTFLLSVDEGFEVGRLVNARVFGDALASQRE